jgi:hydroxylamine dehydrogenase
MHLLVRAALAAALTLGGGAALAAAPKAPAPAKAAKPASAKTADCVGCHQQRTPNIVSDWKLSKHSKNAVSCDACHGTGHTGPNDVEKVSLPTPELCAQCHDTQVEQFKKGKHNFAWAAMKAMPSFHKQPMALMEGQKGCGACHKMGAKTEQEMRDIKEAGGKSSGFGVASCDICHTRHTFSLAEARSPQACQTCHMGFDHPQWEMYSSSKHGVRNELKQKGLLPKEASAPTCQTCHMQQGNHEVRTPWGFLAVRLPMPKDPQWAQDRATILQGLGVLDPDGKPTARLEVVKAAQVARLTQEEFDAERKKLVDTCNQCHSRNFAEAEMAKMDDLIRHADHLMAEAIREVAALYKDGLLAKPRDYAYAFPDLLTFHDAPTSIENELFVMFLEHRMRTFQGAAHNNPDYALWYGWSEMQRSLTKIREEAAALRREHGSKQASGAKAK